ncbi:MAG: SDR family oxidoreductase [Deltaproteobacteria bacterium]|nr:SDR family oxidoreductase [Deltaproteobacteria bacterium]
MAAVLVVGATGAIGSETVRVLRHRGDAVLCAGRDAGRLAALGAEVDAPTAVVDATDASAIDAAVQDAVARFGRLDGVVNAVGSLLLKPAHHTRDDEWLQTITTHATSSFYVLRAAVRVMQTQEGGGSVVLVSSAAARIGLANHEAIAAAKGAIEGLVRSAAATYAARAVRVNAVAPGLVRSRLTERIVNNDKALAASLALHPLGRVGEPGDVARAIAFLVDPAQSFLTGQILGVDGGLADLKTRAS